MSRLIPIITVPLIFLLAACGTPSTTPAATSDTSLPLIKGPARGLGGNDADQVFRSLTVSPNNPSLVFVGTEGNGIFKSADGGSSWTWLRQGLKYLDTQMYPEIWDMAVDPGNNNVVYAAAVGGGNGPLTGSYPSANGGVYKSTDGGLTWTQKTTGFSNGPISSILMDPANSSILYAGVRGGTPSFSHGDVSGQYFEGGIYKSTNSAESWSRVYNLPGQSTNDFWSLVMRSSQIFTLGSNSESTTESIIGFLKSADNGSNWSAISGPSGVRITHFDVSSADANVVYAFKRDGFSVYRTTTGGNSWAQLSPGPSFQMLVKISPFNQQTVYFADIYNLFKSTDGLQTYTIVLTPEGAVDDFEFTSDPNIIYAATMGYIIYKSADGGNTFTKLINLRNYIDSQ